MIDADNVTDLFPDAPRYHAQKQTLTTVLGPVCLHETTSMVTTDGEVRVEPGSYYIAFDVRGNPYPIEESVFDGTYVVVEHLG